MKTIFSTLLAAVLLLSALAGCGKSNMSGENRNTPAPSPAAGTTNNGSDRVTTTARPDGTADGVIDEGEDAVNGVVGAGENAVNDVVGAGEDVVNGVVDAGEDVVNGVVNAGEDAVDDIVGDRGNNANGNNGTGTGSNGSQSNSGTDSTPKPTANP